MATTPPVFPLSATLTAFPRNRSPWVDSDNQRAYGGRSSNAPKWGFPLYKYELTFQLLRNDQVNMEFQNFVGFWNQVMTTPGQYFQYDDPEDDSVTAQLMGTGDGSTTIFQCVRTLGGFTDPVTAPYFATPTLVTVDYGNVTDSVGTTVDDGAVTDPVGPIVDDGVISDTHFYVNGVEVNASIALGGTITFATAPANAAVITWTGPYRWLCQFDDTQADLSAFMFHLWEMKKINFTTARVT